VAPVSQFPAIGRTEVADVNGFELGEVRVGAEGAVVSRVHDAETAGDVLLAKSVWMKFKE
jgi:hypothetical protein